MKIVCIGHAAYDITMPVETYPIENTKNRLSNRVECGGGPAATAAYLLASWGSNVHFLGVVGKDLYGNRIKNELKNVGVNIKYLEMNKDFATTSSFILANKSNGTRTIFTYRSKDMKMKNVTLNFKPDVILVDGQECEMSKNIINKYKDAITIIDAGRATDEIIELSKMVKYLACSKEFAETVTNVKIDYDNFDTLISLYTKMEEIFKNTIIVTLESKGCLCKIDNEIKIIPSISVKAVDSTGAGDIFHGAFTYFIANNVSLEEALKLSNITGAISVTRLGSRNSIPSLKEVKEVYNDIK